MNIIGNKQYHIPSLKLYFVICLIPIVGSLFFTGCAGPLDTATRQALDATYTENTYLAKVYLGNRYNLEYTNNSVDGRSPTGIFIDPSFNQWYETDASFWEIGTSGDAYTLQQLEDIDRDLDFDTFGQGILPGQLVAIKEIDDKSDQIVFEVETLRKHAVTKSYGVRDRSKTKPRAGRIHCVLGKEGMAVLDQILLQKMLNRILVPAPQFRSETEKREFVLSNYSEALLDDLFQLTGFTRQNILGMYYTHLLSQSQLPPEFQKQVVEPLVTNHDTWYQDFGIHLKEVRATKRSLNLDCEIQEISKTGIYHSPELRAGYAFFDKIIFLIESFKDAFMTIPAGDTSFQQFIITCSYLSINKQGHQSFETVTYALNAEDLLEFAKARSDPQKLADRSATLIGMTPANITLSALEAVENIQYPGPTTWKVVEVKINDWDYEENHGKKTVKITGSVKNTGTWIAEDVKVTAQGYDKYGLELRAKSTTLSGLLKPNKTKHFTINMSIEDMLRFELFLKWKEVK